MTCENKSGLARAESEVEWLIRQDQPVFSRHRRSIGDEPAEDLVDADRGRLDLGQSLIHAREIEQFFDNLFQTSHLAVQGLHVNVMLFRPAAFKQVDVQFDVGKGGEDFVINGGDEFILQPVEFLEVFVRLG